MPVHTSLLMLTICCVCFYMAFKSFKAICKYPESNDAPRLFIDAAKHHSKMFVINVFAATAISLVFWASIVISKGSAQLFITLYLPSALAGSLAFLSLYGFVLTQIRTGKK